MIETQNFSVANFDEEMRHFFHPTGSAAKSISTCGPSHKFLRPCTRRHSQSPSKCHELAPRSLTLKVRCPCTF